MQTKPPNPTPSHPTSPNPHVLTALSRSKHFFNGGRGGELILDGNMYTNLPRTRPTSRNNLTSLHLLPRTQLSPRANPFITTSPPPPPPLPTLTLRYLGVTDAVFAGGKFRTILSRRRTSSRGSHDGGSKPGSPPRSPAENTKKGFKELARLALFQRRVSEGSDLGKKPSLGDVFMQELYKQMDRKQMAKLRYIAELQAAQDQKVKREIIMYEPPCLPKRKLLCISVNFVVFVLFAC